MKILLVISDISTFGGMERVVFNLANAFVECGVECEILSMFKTNSNLPYELDSRVKVTFFTQIKERPRNVFLKQWHKFVTRKKFASFIKQKESECDALVFNNLVDKFALKEPNEKYFIFCHGAFKFITKDILKTGFSNVVILSQADKKEFEKYFTNVFVVPNFIDEMPLNFANLDEKIVLAVGRLSEEKGFLRVLEAWSLVENKNGWKLKIVGDGEQKEAIKEKISNLNLSNDVIFDGKFNADIQREYRKSGIYAMSSFFEGFPMVLVEAMSHALPVVAFDVANGPRELVKNGENGFLVADGDLKGYANALQELILSKDLRVKFGENGRKFVEANLSKEKILKKWFEVVLNLQNKKKAGDAGEVKFVR